jgi:hypothetical protein
MKICNPNDIITNQNINTVQQSISCVNYGSGTFTHKTLHIPLFILTRYMNSVSTVEFFTPQLGISHSVTQLEHVCMYIQYCKMGCKYSVQRNAL